MNNVTFIKKIHIHPLFWLVIVSGVLTGYFRETLMIFTIVIIHELGHIIAATYFRWHITKVELLPFGGVAHIDYTDNRPFHEELIVVLAGPFQHLILAAISSVLLIFPFWSEFDHERFLFYNGMILLFNLFPVIPLDGGRLVKLVFTYYTAYVKALQYTRMVSFISLSFLTGCLFIYGFHLNLYVIFLFLIIMNYLEWKQRHFQFFRFLLERSSTNTKKRRYATSIVNESFTLRETIKMLRRGKEHQFIVTSQYRERVYIDERELLQLYLHGNHAHKTLFSLFHQ